MRVTCGLEALAIVSLLIYVSCLSTWVLFVYGLDAVVCFDLLKALQPLAWYVLRKSRISVVFSDMGTCRIGCAIFVVWIVCSRSSVHIH